jgi:hypothetical protein
MLLNIRPTPERIILPLNIHPFDFLQFTAVKTGFFFVKKCEFQLKPEEDSRLPLGY